MNEMMETTNMQRKHPKTLHLPWSQSVQSDDKVLKNTAGFEDEEVIVTEKLDGENTSLYSDGTVHARSISSTGKSWQSAIKADWRKVCHELPEGWRVVGENLYAQHSIRYENLQSWLSVFAIFDENNVALSWDSMVEWCELLGLTPVPVLWRGTWDEDQIRHIATRLDTNAQEGYVVRCAKAIPHTAWGKMTAKWVRKNHVQSDEHWTKTWVPNKLISV